MKKKHVLYLTAALAFFVLVELLLPRQLNWTPTYSHQDKNPFGAYALLQLLPGLFAEQEPEVQSITLYEADTLLRPYNFLVLAETFAPSEEDVKVLLKQVEEGSSALIGAHGWGNIFADTLQIATSFELYLPPTQSATADDSLSIHINQGEGPRQAFRFPKAVVQAVFDSLPPSATVLAQTTAGKPVLISLPYGKGEFVLSTTPLAFTNFFLMHEPTRPYAEAALLKLPEQQPLLWTEYYHLGRLEAKTPLRFILSDEALRWSYYLALGILVTFVLFSLKREQRPIPLVQLPENTSLAFAATLGELYYTQRSHKDIAQKKIIYFLEWLREKYQMPAGKPTEDWIQRLAQKSGKPLAEVRQLFALLEELQQAPALSEAALVGLNQKIEKFKKN